MPWMSQFTFTIGMDILSMREVLLYTVALGCRLVVDNGK